MSAFIDINGIASVEEAGKRLVEAWSTWSATAEQAKRFCEVMKSTKPSRFIGSEYAWALYIKSGANKEGSFDEYIRHNKAVKSWEWEMLNRTYKN